MEFSDYLPLSIALHHSYQVLLTGSSVCIIYKSPFEKGHEWVFSSSSEMQKIIVIVIY